MKNKWNDGQLKTVKPRIGLALGSGAARGWAHIGVINELESLGIVPDIVCGTSIGALVGGLYVGGYLEQLTEWLLQLERKEIIKYLDIGLLTGGGFVEGRKLIDFFRHYLGDTAIEDLPRQYACVATDLGSGREVWFQQGPLLEAIRASIALPGIFTPVYLNDQWLVDGGLVNPVPVSLCRALGAEIVIAVNLNGDLVSRQLCMISDKDNDALQPVSAEATLLEKLSGELKHRADALVSQWFEPKRPTPGLFDVLASSIAIMQLRLTRSRMAGDPPDIILAPRVAHIGLLEFDQAGEAIKAGQRSVSTMLPALKNLVGQ
ncbi:MAG: patatin-like phospholipase family protein [Deltaproteobacteria bacterium]|nr:patatin-like phospholipase family protein [Candidatus Anaeroferrophillus wilburensis]MBN2889193.1 patatin-like phospholipase family protein [Deltaproteobacteria bacterium]